MDNPAHNAKLITEFGRYITERKSALKPEYEKHLADDLSKQQWHDCFQRNVLAAMAGFYDDALQQLQTMPFDAAQYAVDEGMSALTRQVLSLFQGISDEFLQFVVDKHRTSCALSNFPDEHKPDKVYINDVKHGIAELWLDFALNTNQHFLECR